MGDDYSFLQEKIKDEAGCPKRFKKRIIQMILLGIVFGVVACCTFIALKPLGEKFFVEETQEVSIPEDEIIEEEKVEEPEEQEDKAPRETEEQVQKKMLKGLQSTAKDVRGGIVSISGQKSLEESAAVRKTSGVIFADNGSELLILSQTLWNKDPLETAVTFADGSKYEAVWKMCDYNMGIGLLAVSKEKIKDDTWAQIKSVELGNSFQTESGEPGIVMGISSKEELKISYGFVAATEETKEIADGAIELLRLDAAGAVFEDGILFNQEGKMIGLVSQAANGNRTHVISYSISDIKKEIEYMSNGKGVPYMGIWGIVLPDELKKEGLEKGILVQEIDADSPAMKAGIQCGDVITHIGDTEISDVKEYRNTLMKYNEKTEVVLTGQRKGAEDSYVEMNFKVVSGKK